MHSLIIFGALASSGAILAGQTPRVWVPGWTAAQQLPQPVARLSDQQLTDATLRQVVRISSGGQRVRLVLSNFANPQPLTITGVHVARAGASGSSTIEPPSDHPLTFSGEPNVTVPANGSTTSDPVDMPVPALARLAVSMHFAKPPVQQTGHPGSRSTSWLASGDQLAAETLSGGKSIEHWYQLAAVHVEAAPGTRLIVAIGDSITDGRGSKPDTNGRWPDLLADRLRKSASLDRWSVANEGLGGNRVLEYGIGPSALARFDRDVLSQPGVHTVIMLEGVNDLGMFTKSSPQPPPAHTALVAKLTGAYGQLIDRAHQRGLRMVGATILPFGGSKGYHPTALNEADRNAVNAWIRHPGHFDAVIDWDVVVRDPADSHRLKPEFDSGDHLHPSELGYRAMADAISLKDVLQ